MSNYKQLIFEQRCQIEVLKKRGMTQQEMAEDVGTSQSTNSRELQCDAGHRGYRHKQAQRQTDERSQNVAKAVKMTTSMIKLVEQKLVEKWSPEQISG
jgi:transposase, IS30 family